MSDQSVWAHVVDKNNEFQTLAPWARFRAQPLRRHPGDACVTKFPKLQRASGRTVWAHIFDENNRLQTLAPWAHFRVQHLIGDPGNVNTRFNTQTHRDIDSRLRQWGSNIGPFGLRWLSSLYLFLLIPLRAAASPRSKICIRFGHARSAKAVQAVAQ